jgi:DNA recombination protein RmuC
MPYILLFCLLVVIALQALMWIFIRKAGISQKLEAQISENNKQTKEFSREVRQELQASLDRNKDSIELRLESLRTSSTANLEQIRKTLENRLEVLQKDNGEKLEKMRMTVDEKLQSTLEKRLGESFKVVSERLEMVHKGLGEMQGLASDVSDFKRVLTNVKTRGTWGEVQLESLLEQVFIRDHYVKQVMLSKNSKEVCDFAIKLPDKSSKHGFIYLPIDSKFPLEDYARVVAADEINDMAAREIHVKAMLAQIKKEAKSIKEKYILPPHTTDFAVMYVPTESIYAEVLRQPGFHESLQREYRVTISGPTTLAAILSSYQLGFRTLAIAEQTSQVWETLTEIRGDFGKFGDLLEKTKEKLDQASRNIDAATIKTRTIARKLDKAEKLQLPSVIDDEDFAAPTTL